MSWSLIPALFERADPRIVISEEGEPFTIRIQIQAEDGSTHEVDAILDTGCPVDLVSLSFAREHLSGKGEGKKDEGRGDKGKGVEVERVKDEKRQEIRGVKVPGAKLTSSGKWCVQITTTCGLGKTITFKSFCAGIERDPRRPPVVIGMTTLKAQQFYLVPRLQNWWQSCRPVITIGEQTDAVPSKNFEPENCFFGRRKKMPLRVILDTGTVMDGVCIQFAMTYLKQIPAPNWIWTDIEGKNHTCHGLWKLPLCLRTKDDKQRSFTVMCWGMDLGEPSPRGHHSVRLSNATLTEQDIRLDCGTLSISFEESWSQKLIGKVKSLTEK